MVRRFGSSPVRPVPCYCEAAGRWTDGADDRQGYEDWHGVPTNPGVDDDGGHH